MSENTDTTSGSMVIEPTSNQLTLSQVKDAVPKSLKANITQDLVDTLNGLGDMPEEGKLIRDNFLSFSDILKNGNYKTQDYVNACIYASYKIMGLTNTEAYYKTFPDRQLKLKAKGATSKEVSSYVSAFNRGELVQQMMNRAMIPSWLLNQDVFQEAVNTQVELMRTAKSERVRFMAADSLMNHLNKPENTNSNPGLNININSYAGLDDLTSKITELATLQKQAIDAGASTKDIAAEKLIGDIQDAEVVEDEEDDVIVLEEPEEDGTRETDEVARRLFGRA